jgi:hypothetical protein
MSDDLSRFPKPQKPDGIEQWEWDHYMNMELKWISPELRDKVETAMGWKEADVAEAREIADHIDTALRRMDANEVHLMESIAQHRAGRASAITARIRAALRLLENEHITPQGRRILEKILDEEEGRSE